MYKSCLYPKRERGKGSTMTSVAGTSFSTFQVVRLKINASILPFSQRSNNGIRIRNRSRKRSCFTRNCNVKDVEIVYPPEYYDEEWQEKRRQESEEFRRQRMNEKAEDHKKQQFLRELGSRFSGYSEKEVSRAKHLVSSFLRAGEAIEEMIVEAADNEDLSEVVLLVIWNRLEVARKDDVRDEIQALDLLYRRVETEILKRIASPALRLLDKLLNLHDGVDDDEWLEQCKEMMFDVFPPEDPSTITFPAGTDLSKDLDSGKTIGSVREFSGLYLLEGEDSPERHVLQAVSEGLFELPPEDDDMIYRADFVREADELIQEVQEEDHTSFMGKDAQTIAMNLKREQKKRVLQQVEMLRDLAISLRW